MAPLPVDPSGGDGLCQAWCGREAFVRAGRPRSQEAIIVRAGRPRSREAFIP